MISVITIIKIKQVPYNNNNKKNGLLTVTGGLCVFNGLKYAEPLYQRVK